MWLSTKNIFIAIVPVCLAFPTESSFFSRRNYVWWFFVTLGVFFNCRRTESNILMFSGKTSGLYDLLGRLSFFFSLLIDRTIFQCAHGRPTTVPLLNISALHQQLEKLKLNKGGSNEAWHGLRDHPRSIRRAQMLLDSSKRFHSGR